MRNRNLIDKKLLSLEATLRNLERIVNTREPVIHYKQQIAKAQDIVEEIKGFIEAEPMSPNELNRR